MKKLFFAITILFISIGISIAQTPIVLGPSYQSSPGIAEFELSYFSGYTQMWVSNASCPYTITGGITWIKVHTTEGGTYTVNGYSNGSPALSKSVTIQPYGSLIDGNFSSMEPYYSETYTFQQTYDDYKWEVIGDYTTIVSGGNGYNYIRIGTIHGPQIITLKSKGKQNGVWTNWHSSTIYVNED